MLETLYATGIRHAEAQKLDLYDVDTTAHRLTVRLGKGQRDRLVPLTETAAHWLTRYVMVARPELASGQFWGKGKRRLSAIVLNHHRQLGQHPHRHCGSRLLAVVSRIK